MSDEEQAEKISTLLLVSTEHLRRIAAAIGAGEVTDETYASWVRLRSDIRSLGSTLGFTQAEDRQARQSLAAMKCSICETRIFDDQMNLVTPVHARVVTRMKTFPREFAGQTLEVRDRPRACSIACIQKAIETWPYSCPEEIDLSKEKNRFGDDIVIADRVNFGMLLELNFAYPHRSKL